MAALAGVNAEVVRNAKRILKEIDNGTPIGTQSVSRAASEEPQFGLNDYQKQEILDRLKNLDVTTLTPIETMSILYELVKKAKEL